jgi:hypothetical protein
LLLCISLLNVLVNHINRLIKELKYLLINLNSLLNFETDRVIAQTVLCWPLSVKAWVRTRFSPRPICEGQSGIVTGFSPSSSVFPYQYYSTADLISILIYNLGDEKHARWWPLFRDIV